MASETEEIKQVIPIMDAVSPTFCLAKWHHSSIYLHTGQTHSCYHPRPHDIPIEELKTNPSALHNTPTKKQERGLMLVGEKPKGESSTIAPSARAIATERLRRRASSSGVRGRTWILGSSITDNQARTGRNRPRPCSARSAAKSRNR